MIRRTTFILYTIFISLTANSQVLLDCDSLKLKIQHDKDSLPKFDLFMKDRFYGLSFNGTYDENYSFGIGYYLYTNMFGDYRKIGSPSFETSINYHLDGYLYHNFTVKVPFLITPSLSLCTYTDFNKISFFVRPGIGIDAFIAEINYSRNWTVADNLEIATKHNLTAYFRLGIIKNVWHDPDLNSSQWDRHKLN